MELLISYRFNNFKISIFNNFTDNLLIIKMHEEYIYPLPLKVDQSIQMIINK